jgi:undecaprenyl-diphosphatase
VAGAVAALVVVAITVAAIAAAGDDQMSIAEALLLGIVEGLTEYLPVSSTGHLTVAQRLLGLTSTAEAEAAADAYAIAIQGGAIVAVAVLYRRRILGVIHALLRPATAEDAASGRSLAWSLLVAMVPAGVVYFVLGDLIKEYLFGLWPTIAAWAVGGVVILWWSARPRGGVRRLEEIRVMDGVVIGLVQLIALWPGVSRSLVTIIAAMAIGFTIAAAVEFSFLLGFLTLSGATLFEVLDNGSLIVEQFGLAAPLLGFLAAFVSATAAVVWMVGYLQRRSLAIFGWYRLALAATVAVLVPFTGL